MQSHIAPKCVTLKLMGNSQERPAQRRRENLKRFMEAKGLKMKPWADRAGRSEGTLRNFLKGLTDSFTVETAEAFAKAAGVSVAEMFGELAPPNLAEDNSDHTSSSRSQAVVSTHKNSATGNGGLPASVPDELRQYARSAAPLRAGAKDIPIRGYGKGGQGGYFIDQGSLLGFAYRPGMLEDVPDAYALELFDRSMEPALKHGHLALVHPRKTPLPGDDVVVVLNDGETLIKNLVRRTEKQLVLQQYNPPEELKIDTKRVRLIHLIVDSPRVRV